MAAGVQYDVIARLEQVSVEAPLTLLDHRHPATHVLVVLDGEIVEDGSRYCPGDVRWSGADDRHFLRMGAAARCLVIETTLCVHGRRVLRDEEVVRRLRRNTSDTEALDLLSSDRWRLWDLGQEPPAWLAEVRDRCQAGEFLASPGVSAVAHMAGVSREHLARRFRAHFGTSISGAILARRLRQAFDDVRSTDRPLAEIADACGFADQSHLTRQFSAWIGMPPGAVRRITRVQDTAAEPLLK